MDHAKSLTDPGSTWRGGSRKCEAEGLALPAEVEAIDLVMGFSWLTEFWAHADEQVIRKGLQVLQCSSPLCRL